MRTDATSPGSTALRIALWAFATVVGALFVIVSSASSSSAATDGSVDETSGAAAPLAGLLDDLTDGATRPLTDALDPLTAPVEKTVAPVTQPLRDAVAPLTAADGPGSAPSTSAPSTTAPPVTDDAEAGDTSSGTSRPVTETRGDVSPAPTTDESALTDDDAQDAASSSDAVSPDARDRLDALFASPTVAAPDRSVDVADLDFGPRPLPGSDHHTTAIAGVGVMAWEIAATEHVGRDDLLLEVRRGHDTGAATQNFTRPDVSPG